MQNTVFPLIVLVFLVIPVLAEETKPMTVDELFFGDYRQAVEMTKSEARQFSVEENTIVIFFSEEMSPSAVEFTNDFLENRGYDVTIASGLKPPPDQEQALLVVWVSGLMGGVYKAAQIDDGSAYVRIIRTIEKTNIRADPAKVVDLYKND